MKQPTAIAAASVAVALAVGAFALGYGVGDDNGATSTAARQPQVLGQVFARDAETTTTAAPASTPQAPPTSQAPTPTTPTTTATQRAQQTQQTVVTTTSQRTTPGTVITNPECGTGTARASVEARIAPREPKAGTTYDTTTTAHVENGITKPIQVDQLSVRFNYHDRPSQDYVMSGAIGAIVESGHTATFTAPPVNGPVPPDSVTLASFAFHTAGQPQCAGKPA
ncbi:MAG: hypothetical protein JWP02_3029 [Acidimicrobiales bacterium]|nr:hypothetical protein [Acidimicrobiales bacterium]